MAGALIIPTTVALVNDVATETTRGGNMGTYNTFRLVGFGAGPIAAGGVVAAGPYTLAVGGLDLAINGFDAAFYFATSTATLSFVLVSLFVRDPEPSHEAAESLGGVAILDQVLLQAPVGRATDFYGRKRFIVVGMVLLVPTTFVQGVILDPWLMFLARFLQGVAGAMVFAPALALAGDLAPEGQSGSTLSVLTMAFGSGVAFGPLLSGFLVAFGFVVPFAVGAALAAVGAVLVRTQVEETVTPRATPAWAD